MVMGFCLWYFYRPASPVHQLSVVFKLPLNTDSWHPLARTLFSTEFGSGFRGRWSRRWRSSFTGLTTRTTFSMGCPPRAIVDIQMSRLTCRQSYRLNHRTNCLNIATTPTKHSSLIRPFKRQPNPNPFPSIRPLTVYAQAFRRF